MNTRNALHRSCRLVGAASVGLFALAQSAIGQTLSPRVPPGKYEGAQYAPSDERPVLILDDATIARGGASGAAVIEAPVFSQPHDSGFGWFMKSDDVFGNGTWATQQIFGNGFEPGMPITAYETLFFHSSFDDPALGGATVMTELWDGDPIGMMDTVCTVNGQSAPIPGTRAFFSDIPWGALARLRAELSEPVTVDCDRVWTVMTFLEGCRGSWRISGSGGFTWNERPEVGEADGVWLQWSCEQFGACDTPNGYAAGTCCQSDQPCDHSDGVFDCDVNGTDPGALSTFCGNGRADYYLLTSGTLDDFRSYVSTVFAKARATISLVPASADAPPEQNPPPVGWGIEGNEIRMLDGGRPIWLEVRIGDWDPDDTGVRLAGWQAHLDSSGYRSGAQGALTVFAPGCSGPLLDNPMCETALGAGALCSTSTCCRSGPPVCDGSPFNGFPCFSDADCAGGTCLTSVCVAAFTDRDRADFVFAGETILGSVDTSQPDFLWGAVILPPRTEPVDDPEPFPDNGLYAGTLALFVPADAKGTFTINLFRGVATNLVNDESMFVPLLGVTPAKISVDVACVPGPTPSPETVANRAGELEVDVKNRFLSFAMPDVGRPTAVRVTFVDLPAPYDLWNGAQLWVSQPGLVNENGATIIPVPGRESFHAATLTCGDPVYIDFAGIDVVHVFHEGIVPGGTYRVDTVMEGCLHGNAAFFSAPLDLATSVWGDTTGDLNTEPPAAPDGQVDFVDVITILLKFISSPLTVSKSRADLEPGCLDLVISISDVLEALRGWQGVPYPFTPGTADPCDSPCVNPVP